MTTREGRSSEGPETPVASVLAPVDGRPGPARRLPSAVTPALVRSVVARVVAGGPRRAAPQPPHPPHAARRGR